ncbi:competence protein CoiA family protein [Verrucomicrobiota bacterium sgz303538]
MFKSLESDTRREHILLRKTREEVELLREVARNDGLVCPECEAPVRVKAGEIKRWHFAHSVRKDCPLQNESAILLQARALLYEWLEGKFPGRVSIEWRPEGVSLPRPIDCTVTAEKGATLAFWIVEKPIRSPETRWAIRAGLQEAGVIPRWVFLAGMLHQTNPSDSSLLSLSTTERELITRSSYDCIYTEARTEGSLHYLDVEAGELITFRSLRLLHGEHAFLGHSLRDPLISMLITSHGELVHPGEYEHKQRIIEQRKGFEKLCKEEEAYWNQKLAAESSREDAHELLEESCTSSPTTLETMLFVCTTCGDQFRMRDVSQADCANQTCICRSCAGLPARKAQR